MSETFTPPTVNPSDLLSGRVRFNVPGALSLLYGINNIRTFPGVLEQEEAKGAEVSYAGITVVEEKEAPLSPIGTPIMFPITFKGGRYNRYDKDGKVEEVTMQDLRLPITTVTEMSRSKAITKTPVVAANASVKELFAMDDWSIRISGILIDESNQPQGATTIEEMEARLLQWFDLADSIEVDGKLFNQRSIHRLVLKSCNINQMPGKKRMHGFQMEAESDDPLELIIQ